jgi:hypothetical protein
MSEPDRPGLACILYASFLCATIQTHRHCPPKRCCHVYVKYVVHGSEMHSAEHPELHL